MTEEAAGPRADGGSAWVTGGVNQEGGGKAARGLCERVRSASLAAMVFAGRTRVRSIFPSLGPDSAGTGTDYNPVCAPCGPTTAPQPL